MSSWTPDHSSLLSRLLDTVTGTRGAIDIRQDFCRIFDSVQSVMGGLPIYYTGSKSEGLDLPGSDDDFMIEINGTKNIEIKQSSDGGQSVDNKNVFIMETDTCNVRPGFAVLRSMRSAPNSRLMEAIQLINGFPYLSSYLMIQNSLSSVLSISSNDSAITAITAGTQGPSVEINFEVQDPKKPGLDGVTCIHCPFWPDVATEWVTRFRYSRWPSPADIARITHFGFHLVPIGHPLSDLNMMEWRISFSLAERTLVWSFNHVQMQCYAMMKILLKEFIKRKCTTENYILCSYFIKTFLFWKFEEKPESFWQRENFRECLHYVLREFFKCIEDGLLRHYFIPRFNLLEIKLTPAAQSELLQLLGVIIDYDVSIMQCCQTLSNVWIQFNQCGDSIEERFKQDNIISLDFTMSRKIKFLATCYNHQERYLPIVDILFHSRFDTFKTTLIQSAVKLFLCQLSFSLLPSIQTSYKSSNKAMYDVCRYFDKQSFDISTCKLMKANMFFMLGDYIMSLHILNNMLSSIPPFPLYCADDHSKQLYSELNMNSSDDPCQRAKKSWLFDLKLNKKHTYAIPCAIQIEFLHCDPNYGVSLSPFTYAYYLMFLCYDRLGKFQNRDCALRQLVEVANDEQRCGLDRHHSYNIAGHCLWYLGDVSSARFMFILSYAFSCQVPHLNNFNSAIHYLRLLE